MVSAGLVNADRKRRAISTSAGIMVKFHDSGSSVRLPFWSGANRPQPCPVFTLPGTLNLNLRHFP